MFYSARRRFARALHDRRCAAIMDTPPLVLVPGPVRIVSMVCHRDLILYLVAAKSFYRRLGSGSFVLIDDGSLTAEDRAHLAAHLGEPQFFAIDSILTGACPKGGTWERLLKIVDMTAAGYVVQLDADTLTVGPIAAVTECIAANVSFTLGTGQGRALVSLATAAQTARGAPGNHLQDVAERNLDRLGLAAGNYVRGCSGFAGFAKDGASRAVVEDFSRRMAERLGGRWTEWGSEQVTSNYVVANAPSARVLPYPDYSGFEPGGVTEGVDFLHFIGSYRYAQGTYTRLSRSFIETL